MNLFDRRTLVDVELLLLAEAKQQATATLDPAEEWWLGFQAAAPGPLLDYVVAIDAEAAVDPTYECNPDMWIQRCHPLVRDAIEALHDAIDHQHADRLASVQGVVIKIAWWRLTWHFAKERAAGKTGPCFDGAMQQRAAEALLGWSMAEAHEAWSQPEQFIERWRESHTRDAEILDQAGLHGAELQLLESMQEV